VSNLHQIQVAYHPEQDRLLLRASTRDGREFRFWLTRRLVKGLRPALHKTLVREVQVQSPGDPQAQREVLRFRREEAVRRADFATPYQEGPERSHPLGEEPVLVSRIALSPPREGRHTLTLLPRTGQGCNLALNEDLLHSLAQLLEQAVGRAGWDLEAAREAPPEADPDGGRRLN
jgi:hypothetical protein